MWMLFCLLCLVLWGLWGFFPKLAVRQLGEVAANDVSASISAAVYQGAGSFLLLLPVAIVGLALMKYYPNALATFKLPEVRLVWETKGATYAALAGITVSIGGLLYVLAASTANVSVVVTITALYPIVTILLGWQVLHEQILPRQWVGIVLALIAMALVAQAPEKKEGKPVGSQETVHTTDNHKGSSPAGG